MNQKDNKSLHNKQNNNNSQKISLKNNEKKIRPSSKGKIESKIPIKNFKKSNTSKKISIKNLNECAILPKESKESKEKKIPKKNIKKEIHKKDSHNINNINNSNNNTNQTSSNSLNNLNIIDQISNLTSLYNALSFINNKIDSNFSFQRKEAEHSLYDKYSEGIELKEKNFKLFQQINSMTNIIDIDDYFVNNYSKMMGVYPKISNVIENMNDIVSNINYSVDRMFLIDDLLCDENILQQNIINIKNNFEIMNNNLEKKIEEINGTKNKYNELYNKLNTYEEEIKKIENKLGTFKQNVLTNNIEIIHKILSDKNKKLLNEILNE